MTHRCKACQKVFFVKRNNVRRDWIRRGYDGDYKAFLLRCPHCGKEEETTFFKLPFKIALKALFKK